MDYAVSKDATNRLKIVVPAHFNSAKAWLDGISQRADNEAIEPRILILGNDCRATALIGYITAQFLVASLAYAKSKDTGRLTVFFDEICDFSTIADLSISEKENAQFFPCVAALLNCGFERV